MMSVQARCLLLCWICASAGSCSGPGVQDGQVDLAAQVDAAPPPPVLTSVTPALGPNSGGVQLTLKGASFAAGAVVLVAGAAASGVQLTAEGQLVAILPPLPGARGPVPVVIRNPDGSSVQRADLFSYYSQKAEFMVGDPVGLDAPVLSSVVGDLSADRQDDVAAILGAGAMVKLTALLSKGRAGLQPPATTMINPATPIRIDANGDRKADLVLATSSGLFLLQGLGDGTFLPARLLDAAPGPSVGAAGDVNGDGKQDLVAAGVVLLGDGDGAFRSVSTVPVGVGCTSIALGDLSGDGTLDIAARCAKLVVVLVGRGDGSFQAVPNTIDLGATTGPLLLGDADEDGRLDALTYTQGGPVLFLGKGDGTFQGMPTMPVGDPQQLSSYAFTDLNGDRHLDLVVLTSAGASVALGSGSGTFQPLGAVGGAGAAFLRVGDLDGDGKPDLVLLTGQSAVTHSVRVLFGL